MPSIRYDFRSDTVTRPSPGMRAAMAAAEVGDDVFGDDPTVLRLEAVLAERTGKEAGLFLPSGTQSNLVGLMAHCGRGDEFIVGQGAHCYKWEAGGAAVLGSIQPQPIANQPDGTLALTDIADAIKPDDPHFACTRLLALENTIGGQVLSLAYMRDATALARRHGLACHLDGARVFNAATALGVPVAEVAASFDTVSICLSKGLGAPIGSVLVGPKDVIARARRIRKMVGGGLRQVGVLAAAGLYALDHNVERLADDHAHAQRLAKGLDALPGVSVGRPDTNILFVDLADDVPPGFADHLAAQGIGLTSTYGGKRQRWVTHLDVDARAVDEALRIAGAFLATPGWRKRAKDCHMSVATVRAHLATIAPEIVILELETSTATVALAAAGHGVAPARIAKTLSLRVGGTVVLLVTRGDARLDNRKAKAAFGGKIKMLDAGEVESLTGHPVGGVCPFGLATPLPVYCDVSLKAFDEVVPAAGSTNSALRISPLRMAEITGAQWVDACQEGTFPPRIGDGLPD